jgi:mono/diheme cytochrome c family protein
VAVHPGGRTIYVATDSGGLVEARGGGTTSDLEDRGAILAFRYTGEGAGTATERTVPAAPLQPRDIAPPAEPLPPGMGVPPVFSASQAAGGRKAYESHCAVCHGTTLTNGTFGTPLAGEFFRSRWSGRSVAALFMKSRNTMPPAAPASLPDAAYAEVVAYILEVNGAIAGTAELPAGGDRLTRMRIP